MQPPLRVLVVVGRQPLPGNLLRAVQGVARVLEDAFPHRRAVVAVLVHWSGHGAGDRVAATAAEVASLGRPVDVWGEPPLEPPPLDLVLDLSLVDTVLTVVGKKSVSACSGWWSREGQGGATWPWPWLWPLLGPPPTHSTPVAPAWLGG
jgi:hypothetical protein